LHRSISFCRVRGNGRAPMLRRHKEDVTNVLRLVLEAVADAPYGLDTGLLELRGREFAAQARHVDVDRSGLDEAVAAPSHVAAPPSKPRTLSPSSTRPLTMITGICARSGSFFRRRHTSQPLSWGTMMSSRITSGRCSRASRRASFPFALRTTSYPSFVRLYRI